MNKTNLKTLRALASKLDDIRCELDSGLSDWSITDEERDDLEAASDGIENAYDLLTLLGGEK